MATQEGASLDLVPVLIGTFIVLLGIGSLFVYERPLHAVLSGAVKFSVAVTGRPRGDTVALIDSVVAWMTAVRLSWSQIGCIITWGTINWLLDCACFAMMFLALGVPIPWKGLLLAYGAGQLAASLPITPGGLGVVEGSITVALVAFGGSGGQHGLRRPVVPAHQLLDDPGGRVALHRTAGAPGPPGALAPAGSLERGRGRPRGLRDAGCGSDTRPRPVPLRREVPSEADAPP